MSKPDKTLISIQIGKTTEEQVRFQCEKHLRTFIICSQLDANTSQPGLEQQTVRPRAQRKQAPGPGGGSPAVSSAGGSASFDHLFFTWFC